MASSRSVIFWMVVLTNGFVFISAAITCNYVETSVDQGSIKFPNSDDGEGPNTSCTWTFQIESPGGPLLYLDFSDVYLDAADTFEIYDGYVWRTWLGTTDPFMVIGNVQDTVININTSPSVEPRNILILYSTMKCSTTSQVANGVFRAPIYSVQPGYLHCTWAITSDWENQVLLSFYNFQVTTGAINIENSGVLNSYIEMPPDTISTSRHLLITMTAYMEQANESFEAAYTFVRNSCSGKYIISGATSLQLSQPKVITNYCVLLLKADDSSKIIAGNLVVNSTTPNSDSWAATTINEGRKFGKNLLYHSSLSNQGATFSTSGDTAWVQFVQYGEGVVLNLVVTSD